MKIYLILYSYYLFFCTGLLYLVRINSRIFESKLEKIKREKMLRYSFINKVNCLASKVGYYLGRIYKFESIKKYGEVLDSFSGEKKIKITFNSFIGYKVIIMILFTVAGGFIGSNLAVSIILSLAGGTLGYFTPDLLLKKFNNKRLEELNNDLPYIIDLLYIATLSGQNVYNAIKIVTSKYSGSICQELVKFLKDIDFGIGKFEAYKNILARNNSNDFKKLFFLLMQAEKYGSSISEVLKQKSKSMKFEISQNLERRSKKISLLMLFPLAFLILPSFVILVCGPLIYSIGGNFIRL